jgi:hypothetical protein
MSVFEKVFSKTPPAPTPSPALQNTIMKQRTMGDLRSAADIQRKYDPTIPMPIPAPVEPIKTPTAIMAKQGTPTAMQPQPEGYTK